MNSIISAPKTDVFRLRVNPEIRKKLETIYAKNGLTLTDAIKICYKKAAIDDIQETDRLFLANRG